MVHKRCTVYGKRLMRDSRKKYGGSFYQISKVVDVKADTLYKTNAGTRNISVMTCYIVCRKAGLNLDDYVKINY